MRKQFILLVLLTVVACPAFGELTVAQLAGFEQRLSSVDRKVRVSALEDLEKTHLETAGNGILPSLSKALSDPDPIVRAGAAGSLAVIAYSTAPKLKQTATNETDLRSYPPLPKALIATFTDVDEETRKNALVAYLFTFEVSGSLQNTLVSRYDSERQNSLFRSAILEAIIIDGTPTPTADALLIQVANNPNSSADLAQIIQDAKAPPEGLLSPFVNQFNTAPDSARRALFARAIGKFGVLAKRYIPLLARAADLEPDDNARQTIKNVIAKIRATE